MRFGSNLYRQIVGISMGTNYADCAPLVADLFLFCCERADLLALVCDVYYEFVTFSLVSWVRCGT